MKMTDKTTSWVVTALGAAVAAAGASALKRGPLAAGAMGFGAAHIIMGLLNMSRLCDRHY